MSSSLWSEFEQIVGCCKPALPSSIFHEPRDVTYSEMNAISFALFKDATMELEEIPQFYVRRIEDDSIDVNSLVWFKRFVFIYIFWTILSFELFCHFLNYSVILKYSVIFSYDAHVILIASQDCGSRWLWCYSIAWSHITSSSRKISSFGEKRCRDLWIISSDRRLHRVHG